MVLYGSFFIIVAIVSSSNSIFQFFRRRARSSLPSAAFLNSASLSFWRILLRALVLTTMFSQSCEGFWFLPDMISTTSPVLSFSVIFTALPLTLPPVHFTPRLVWMSNAKSSTVAPAGSLRNSPDGVNTKTSLVGIAMSSSS